MKTSRQKQGGFTLIEVLIAVMIIGLSYIALVKLNVINLRLVAESNKHMTAVRIARSKLHETGGDAVKTEIGETFGTIEDNNQTYRWQRRITEIGVDGVVKVEVTVGMPLGPPDAFMDITFYEYYARQ